MLRPLRPAALSALVAASLLGAVATTPAALAQTGSTSAASSASALSVDQARAAAVRILNADDPDLRSRAASWDQARWVTAQPRQWAREAGIEPHLWIEADQVLTAPDGAPLLDARALAMPGEHNRQNLLMAVAVGLELGLEPAAMEAALRSFPGVPHRLERIRSHDGVTWFNDSKATNYDAAEVALRALEGPLVVLAGGEAKQGDAQGWLAGLRREAAAVVLFGAAQGHFEQLLEGGGYGGAVHRVDGLRHVAHRHDGVVAARSGRDEPRRHRLDVVAVAHPHL